MSVAETASFLRQAAKLWTEDDRSAFVNYVAANPDAGDVIADTGALRKIRWSRDVGGAAQTMVLLWRTIGSEAGYCGASG